MKNDEPPFLIGLFQGWWALGPRNVWFWVVPAMVISVLVGIITGNHPSTGWH